MAARRRSRAGEGREAGFTLVELLVVLAVIGLLIVAAPAIVSAARPGAELRAATLQLANDLRSARTQAISGHAEVAVVFGGEQKTYVAQPGGAPRKLARGIGLAVSQTEPSNGEASILFFPDGSSSGGEVRLSTGEQSHRIVAHALTGRISVDE